MEDTRDWGQRPKLDVYDDHVFLVFYSAEMRDDAIALIEVHLFISGRWVVTVHRDPCPALEALAAADGRAGSEAETVYRILDALTDAYEPIVGEIEAKVDALELEVFERVRRSQLERIYRLKQDVSGLTRRVSAQRDAFPATSAAVLALPGLEPGGEAYLRDVGDHLALAAGEFQRQAMDLHSLTDTYFNANTNRLNMLATRLSRGGHLLPGLDARDRLLRPELRLARALHRLPARLRGLRRGPAGGPDDRPRRLLLAAKGRLVLAAPVGSPPDAKSARPSPTHRTGGLLTVAVDVSQVAQLDVEPGELPATMAAWVIREERFGEPMDAIQLEEIEVPEPGAFEVVVRVMAAGVNFNNVWAALGQPVSVFRYHPEDHHIGGSDASGIVWKVGEGVTRWKPGDEVVVHCNQASYEDPEVHGLDPLAAPVASRSGATRPPGAPSPSSARSRPSSCCPSPRA